MARIHVRPAPGRLVRDPVTHAPLPEEGALVEDSTYWRRRIRVGDVVVVKAVTGRKAKRG
ncbi:DUF2635 domain-containing protein [Dissulfurirhabdus thermomarina]|uniref:DUF2635 domain-containing protein n=1 Tax=Dissulfurirhabdus thermomarina TaxID=1765737 RepID=A0A6N9TJ24_DISTH|nr:DUF2635 domain-containing protein [Dissulfurirhabdus thermomarina]NDY41252.1 DUF2635 domain-containing protein [Dissulfurirhabdus thermomarina]